jgi:hypothetical protein
MRVTKLENVSSGKSKNVRKGLEVSGLNQVLTNDDNINILLKNTNISQPVPMAAQPKARTIFDRSNTGIVGSNPARGIDVCPRVSVLCCPVSVEDLRLADPPSKESYQMSKIDS